MEDASRESGGTEESGWAVPVTLHEDGSLPAAGTRVRVRDPRTGVTVYGEVDHVAGGRLAVDPQGVGYEPGGFVAGHRDLVEAYPDGDETGRREHRARMIWDIHVMTRVGALENLDESTLDYICESMTEGHL